MDARRILVCAICMAALFCGADGWGLNVAAQEPQPAITLSESEHDFENVSVGQGAYWTLRITNEGTSDLSLGYTITSGDGSFGFDPERMPPTSPTVSPGDSLELFLLFKPTSSGPHDGTLTIQSNDPNTPELEVPLTGRGVEPKIVLSDATHEFGDVLVGQASDYWMLRITNEGEGDLFILNLQVVPKESKEFQFDANRFPSEQERTIAPGGALDLFLFFAPTSSGLWEGKVIVQSDDPNTPELEVPLTGRGIAPRMALSESTHDFGSVLVGQSADWTLRVTNEGDGDLILGYSMTSENGAFGFDPDRMPPTEPTLAPGETLEFVLRFAPTSSGIQEGTLTLQSNDPDTPESEIPLTGRGIEPKIALSESAHDFGNVLVGQVAYWTLRITNEGDGDLYLDPSVTPLTAGFGWDETQLPQDWRIVSPGKTLELVLGFAPGDTTLIGLQTATLTLKSNDPDDPEVVVTMKGTCVKVPRPAIRILESHHDFGNVPVRQGAYWTLRITNAGNADLSIGYSVTSGDGSFGWDPERLPPESPTVSPGDTLELFLLFAPISSGYQEGTVILPSNDPDAPELEVKLEGHGVLPGLLLSESEHDFGDVQVGQGAYWTLRIDNTGEADLSIGYTITSEEGSFGWDPERVPTEQTVSPGEPLELFLMFAPKSSGLKEGTLVIESSDPNNPKLEVNLQGYGSRPRMVLSASEHDFGDVRMGQGARWTLRLSNEGESALSIGYSVTSGDASFGWDPERVPTEQTVSPGDTLEFFLLFVPASLGPHSGTVTIQSNDPHQPEVVVNMTGAGVEAPQPDIRVSETEHDFGDVEVGQAAYWTLRIFNEGKADLFLGYVLTSEYGSYGWDPQRQPPTEPTISPGDTLEFVVGFAPNDTTLQTGTLILETNDPDEPEVEIPLRGTGVAPPPSPPPAQPQIGVEESYDFGNVAVGQTADWTLRITNGGEADLSIIGLRLTPEEAEFAFDDTRLPTKWTLALGDTMELFLFFAPSSSGLQEGTVIIQSTDPDRPEVQVALSGIGAEQDIALEASEHDFGDVDIEHSGQWELVIRNEGTMPLSVETVWLKTGSVFSLEALSLPQTIEPDATLSVTVGFTPIAAGSFRDVLVVDSDDPDEKALEVRLVGTGKQQIVQRMDCPEVTRAKTYQMISIPLMMTNGSAEWALGPVLGAYDKALWRLFRYQNEKYVEYGGGIAPFSPGRGFWLITRESVRLYAGPGRSAIANTPEGDFKITLQPGWNMIGVPFDFPVAWSQVDLGGKNVEPPVAFDGMAFRYNQTTLEPWHGYAVKNPEPTAVDLRIPPIRTGKSSPSKEMGSRKTTAPPGGWTMNIKVCRGGSEDVENALGWLPEAREAWDAHERSEAPPIGDFVALYFDHRDWERYPGRYTTDFRPSGMEKYVWNFVVGTNAPSEEATLHWEKSLPAGMAGVLIDRTREVCVDMAQTDAYRFSFGAQDMVGEESESRRAFRLIVGTSGFVAEERAGASKKPDAFRLAQNVPNPFNPRTAIRFEVPGASGGAVELAVFDLLGQKVRTLASGSLEAGSHEITWDGRDEMGRDVSSGVYVARLKGEGFVGVRKMVLIR